MAIPSLSASGTRGLLRQDCLHADAIPHWLTSPWFPEHWDELVLPLEFGGRVIYVATSGLVLFLPPESMGVVLVDGHTGEASSNFSIERRQDVYSIEGIYSGETVNLQIQLAPGSITVKGPALQVRSDYEIFWDGQAWSVVGSTGEFESSYRLLLEAEDRLHIEGTRRGTRIDQSVFWNKTDLMFESAVAPLSLRPTGPQGLLLEGTLHGDLAELQFLRAADELRIVGSTGLGKVNYQITQEPRGLIVKGRFHKWFVNYKVEMR